MDITIKNKIKKSINMEMIGKKKLRVETGQKAIFDASK